MPYHARLKQLATEMQCPVIVMCSLYCFENDIFHFEWPRPFATRLDPCATRAAKTEQCIEQKPAIFWV